MNILGRDVPKKNPRCLPLKRLLHGERKKKVVAVVPAPMKAAKVMKEPKKAKVVPQKPAPMKAAKVIQETPVLRRSSRNK